MASITEHVTKLQELTQTNLELLQAINDSFFAKQEHLSVKVGESSYAMPSFISLENKLNALTANFENLIHAPETGEAIFDFNGNTRAIQVRPYTSVPNSLVLSTVDRFNYENNDIFKDFMTPTPYINMDVKSLPNDIVEVLVKKVIPIHPDLVNMFKNNLHYTDKNIEYSHKSIVYPYKDLYKVLNGGRFKQDVDYIEYDSKIELPTRKNIGSGIYVIETVLDDTIDEHLDNYVKIKLRNDLTDSIYMNSLKYRLFDETIEVDLKVGDQLVTYEGNAKLEITKLESNNNIITAKVLYGDFLNLVESDTNDHLLIPSLSKLKFFSPVDFNNDKYVKVPLEEDQYVFIALAALNSRMNVQSAWGSGLMLNTYELTSVNNEDLHFNDYYRQNVKNVGDILFEITSMMSNTITSHSKEEFNRFTTLQPSINKDDLLVTQINKHLNDSIAVQNIRSLYSQKKDYQSQLSEIQSEIDSLNNILTTVSFDDTSGMRTTYVARLSDLAAKKNEIVAVISKILNEIATSANNSEVPIENAKYRIRGFFNYKSFLQGNNEYLIDHIKGIRVQYRYKNVNYDQGTALTINDKFIFSDWNEMQGFDRERIAIYDGGYKFRIQDDNDIANEPSFNQIDIPISQGESVDIRLKLVYDFGYPFVQTTSDWSTIVNIKFPDEFLKDVKLLDIIEENNNEIESNRFNNILKNEGIPEHISDKIVDQDITYYHKPENIASGFYTAERRIIPLKDKLSAIDNALAELREEVFNTSISMGSAGSALVVSIKHGDSTNNLQPLQVCNIPVESYGTLAGHITDKNTDQTAYNGIYTIDTKTGIATTLLNINLYNDSNHVIKLYSMFPGNRDTNIYSLKSNKYNKTSYALSTSAGVWLESNNQGKVSKNIQGGNQFLYFRLDDVNDGTMYYENGANTGSKNDILSMTNNYKSTNTTTPSNTLAYMYPKLTNKYSLCIDSNSVGSYLTIAPGEEISIPIIFEYYIKDGESISKTMSFDILPSLYKDPITYTFKVNAKYSLDAADKVVVSGRMNLLKNWLNWGTSAVKYKSTFK